ncbi:MAG: hypothetical protein AB7T05_02980, partial [Fimbriimonadaceae bacterium]
MSMTLNMVAVAGVAAATGAVAGGIAAAGFVNLQDVTPGTAQTGHTNISGYSLAGRFGSGVSPTLARVQVKETGTLQGVRSESGSGVAVFGKSTAASGLGAGGYFTTSSVGGRGIVGDALSGTGNTVGGLFYNRSTGGGVGVWGRAIGAGTATGVFGEVTSANGTALAATNGGSGNRLTAGTANDSLQTVGALPRHQYAANQAGAMVPIAYGIFDSIGGNFYGTPNWTGTNPGTGQYDIDIAGSAFSRNTCVVVASSYGSGGVEVATIEDPTSGDFRIAIRNEAGTLIGSAGYFVVYRLAGLGAFPFGDPEQKLPYGGDIEKWQKNDPRSFEAYRKK